MPCSALTVAITHTSVPLVAKKKKEHKLICLVLMQANLAADQWFPTWGPPDLFI